MATTNFVNRNSLKAAFNADNNSFNRAFRFLHELSKVTPAKIPAAPASDDKTPEANRLRVEIKRNTAINNNIADAKKIMQAYNVAGTCNDKVLKEARKMCDLFLPNVCKKTVKKQDGSEQTIFAGVKFSKLPGYMKEIEGVDYKKTFIVIESSWIERIFDAAEEIQRLTETGIDLTKYQPEEARNIFELTEAPHKEDTTPAGSSNKVFTWQEANGHLVNESGHVIENLKDVFKIWYKEAIRNSDANAAGNEAKKEYLKNNK